MKPILTDEKTTKSFDYMMSFFPSYDSILKRYAPILLNNPVNQNLDEHAKRSLENILKKTFSIDDRRHISLDLRSNISI